MPTPSDDEILASVRAGDVASFAVLYRRYSERGMRYAGSVLRNASDAEEVVQEAFCRLLRAFRTDAPPLRPGGLGATFFKTLRNLTIDALRRRRLRAHVSLEAAAEPAAPFLAHVDSAAPERARVRALLSALPSQAREALELRVAGGLSYDEIAAVLGATRAQVRTWIYRARRSLEALLEMERSRDARL
jgi:RNA polymerase sigma-70 factor (ECF subfamily)